MQQLVRLKKESFSEWRNTRFWSEAQEIQKGWNWGKMLPFTFCSLHEIKLALSMISFRPSLVYFKILYIVQCLLTWWIRKILARGRMSHSDTSLWERKRKLLTLVSPLYPWNGFSILIDGWALLSFPHATSPRIWFCPQYDCGKALLG